MVLAGTVPGFGKAGRHHLLPVILLCHCHLLPTHNSSLARPPFNLLGCIISNFKAKTSTRWLPMADAIAVAKPFSSTVHAEVRTIPGSQWSARRLRLNEWPNADNRLNQAPEEWKG